ncbi:glucose 1-dehydrogenase [Tellurirhabdus bombi]|uniref:glucose 1-dehydrogenase n=1 Tax=Tellurirhabdus bombi TaxID=2907205 RepID=UPI001F47C6C6|nr:glucose 1-dehydrogenase [Tellurirhabdus bombi]
MKLLENKVALITGAGSGIGKAIAHLFAAEAACVLLTDIYPETLEAVVLEIGQNSEVVSSLVADISHEKDIDQLFDEVLKRWGRLDILVNNAGVMDDFTPVADVSNALWNQVIGVNLTGPFYSCRKAIPIMLKQGAGVILNVASIGGLYGGRAGAAYTASKHGLIGLTKNIGYQYAPKGIRCNAIAPGGVSTNIMQNARVNPFGFERMSAGAANNIRTAQAAEIAELALFLASDKASFLNGTTVTADGGWTAY